MKTYTRRISMNELSHLGNGFVADSSQASVEPTTISLPSDSFDYFNAISGEVEFAEMTELRLSKNEIESGYKTQC